MKNFIGISVTYYTTTPKLNEGYCGYVINGMQYSRKLDIEEALARLAKLEKRLGQAATVKVNRYNPTIYFVELYGYVDQA